MNSMASNNTEKCSGSEITSKVHQLVNALIIYCRSKKEKITQKTALIVVKVILLNPKWKHIPKEDISDQEVHSFIEVCFHFLFDEKNLSSTTIKMLIFFHGRYLSRDQYKEYQNQVMMKSCFHLLQKLKKVWHNPTEDFKDMHNDLIQLALIKVGMNNKEDCTAFEEMKTAINSVFPPSSLSTFVLSNQKTKMAYINEVSSIAAGIRLHAWYSDKAGRFMFDVGKIMKVTLPKVCEDLHDEISDARKNVEKFQNLLKEKVMKDFPNSDIQFHQEKLLLINAVNYFEFLKILKKDIEEIAIQTYKLDYTFAIQIKELNTRLKTGPFTTADKVYPSYKSLAETWKSIQLEGHLLDFYISLFQELKKFSELAKLSEVSTISEVPVSDNNDSTEYEEIIVIHPDDVKNFEQITLEYQGYCAWFCTTGVLLPSNRYLGIIMYKGLCYGFSSEEAMESFKGKPNECIAATRNYMMIMPEFIITLRMEAYFQLPIINNIKFLHVTPIFISDCSVQTILHPTETNIDYTYNWNQWNLRKQAIKYADLVNKRTHSTQTNLSHFRRENYSQVYLPKDNWTQTRRDTGTTMCRTGMPELYRVIKKSFL